MVDSKRKIAAAHPRSEPSKRQRVSRACDQCRLAREKCDGIQPTCFTCASSNRLCSYTANPRKRGIQPGYIRTLELTLAWSFANVPGAEDSLKQALHDGKTQAVLSGKDVDSSNKLHRKWRRSLICKGIDRLLSGSALDSDELDELDTVTEGEEEEQQGPQPGPNEGSLPTPVSQSHPASTEHHVRFEDGRSTSDTSPGMSTLVGTGTSARIKLPDDLWRLFDIYFSYTHNWLPIVEKHDILRIAYSYPQDGIDYSSPVAGSGEHALLWSILAVASFQQAATTGVSKSTSTTYKPHELLRVSRLLVNQHPSNVELGYAQALLLHALIEMSSANFDAAWISLGRAIRVALLLDSALLTITTIPEDTPDRPGKRTKHVLLACFVLETLLSTHLHKLPMLNYTHLPHLGMVPEDSLEEWHPWDGCPGFGAQISTSTSSRIPSRSLSIFNQLVKLMSVLSAHLTVERTHSSILPQMDNFLAMLPSDHLLNLDSHTNLTPQKLTLHLAFQGIVAAFGLPDEQNFAATQIVELVERFRYSYGTAAFPPFFAVLFNQKFGAMSALPSHSQHIVRSQLKALNDIWGAADERKQTENEATSPSTSSTTMAKHPTIDSMEPASSLSISHPSESPGWIGIPFASPGSTGLSQQYAAHNLDASSMAQTSAHIQGPAAPLQNPLPPDAGFADTAQLQRYNSVGSLDLDALFDDLDGPERATTHPQFMQNLGFAPGADLTDILTSDYGQFDPLLTAYMSGNALALQSNETGGIFDPG